MWMRVISFGEIFINEQENSVLKLDNRLMKARLSQRSEEDDEPNFDYDVIKDQKSRLVQIAADKVTKTFI